MHTASRITFPLHDDATSHFAETPDCGADRQRQMLRYTCTEHTDPLAFRQSTFIMIKAKHVCHAVSCRFVKVVADCPEPPDSMTLKFNINMATARQLLDHEYVLSGHRLFKVVLSR